MELVITAAGVDEAAAVLELQRLCYQSEAALYGDYSIPPLTQTLAGIEAEFETHRFLAARLGGELAGSVRARAEGGTCRVGRLIVHPRHQRQGIGSRLLHRIEDEFPAAHRFELFTGHRSEGNLRLYRRHGYREFRRLVVSPRLTLVFMEKLRGAAPVSPASPGGA